MLTLLIVIPMLGAAVALAMPSERLRPWLLVPVALIHLALVTAIICVPTASGEGMLGLDALGKLVLMVVSLLFAISSLYAVGYFHSHPDWTNRIFVTCLFIFLSAMTVAAAARHLGLLWVAVEATTVASAPMIYFNHNRYSIEATWKYLLFCSVGIALAMLGILFLAYAGLHGGATEQSLQFDFLLRQGPLLSKPWLRVAFVFLLVGFGTKMGLAPLHTWKPDAYGEAPGLAGALMSGGLTSIAFLAVLRVVQILNGAGEAELAGQCLLGLGLTSLFIAAVFVIRQRDIKRMLAYSSVEHMGILAIGIAVGGLATYGALFHVLNNALAKGSLFMSAGNIHRYFGSKKMCETQGAISVLPWSASLFLVGFLAVTGSPPFGAFISEFTILQGIFGGGHNLLGLAFIVFLAVIFIGMSHTVVTVALGPPLEQVEGPEKPVGESFLTVLGPLVLLGLVLLLGLYQPEPLRRLLTEAAALLEVKP